MGQAHSRTVSQRLGWVSQLIAHSGSYGVVSSLSRISGVARQTLYRWKAKGQAALARALTPLPEQAKGESSSQLERASLPLLVEGHASQRGIQVCLRTLLGWQVSLGTSSAIIQTAEQRAIHWMSKQAPKSVRALDELYGSQRGEAYQSAGGCTQWSSLGQHQSSSGGWRKLDAAGVADARARHPMAYPGQ